MIQETRKNKQLNFHGSGVAQYFGDLRVVSSCKNITCIATDKIKFSCMNKFGPPHENLFAALTNSATEVCNYMT